MKILHVIANPKPTNESASKQITEGFLAPLKNTKTEITTIDLYKDEPPHYSYATYRNFWWPIFVPDYKPSKAEKEASAYAERHAKLFNTADVLVITTPMWNFSIPSILKAWIDQVLAPGLTFTISAEGVKPLHKIKKVIVLAASGGAYPQGDPRDTLIPQIKAAFGFVGIKEVEYAWAQGQNPFFFKDHEERKENAKRAARDLGEIIAAL